MTDELAQILGENQRATTVPPGLVPQRDSTPASVPIHDGHLYNSEAIDGLFRKAPSYRNWKNEQPWHRLALYMILRGQSVNEVAVALGKTPGTVYQLRKQEWFQEAFCQLAHELGKEPVKAMLQGEVLEAVERTVQLAKGAESEQVRLAANKEILDRFLGKAAVTVENKHSGVVNVNNVVYDAQALLDEQKRLDEQLKAKGLSGGVN